MDKLYLFPNDNTHWLLDLRESANASAFTWRQVSATDSSQYGLGYVAAAVATTPHSLVLAGGGYSGNGQHPKTSPVAAVWGMFGGQSNKLIAAPPLPAKLAYAAAVGVPNTTDGSAEVYVIGGITHSTPLTTVYRARIPADRHDIAGAVWHTAPSLTTARWGAGAAVAEGSIYVFGGMPDTNSYTYKRSTEAFNIATGGPWRVLPESGNLLAPLAFSAVAMWDCVIVCAGGVEGGIEPSPEKTTTLKTVQTFDVAHQRWVAAGNSSSPQLQGWTDLPAARSHASAVMLSLSTPVESRGAAMLVMGGANANEEPTAELMPVHTSPCPLNMAADPFGECTQCAEGYYGIQCKPCPGVEECQGECFGHGQCDDGVDGYGTCSCDNNWAEPYCTTCPAPFGGGDCGDCLPGRFGPSCDPCDGFVGNISVLGGGHGCHNHGNCSGAGTTSGSGTCECYHHWNGTTCGACPHPYTGQACDSCRPGHWGALCSPCDDCHGHGSCDGDATTGGTGTCVCFVGFSGANCTTGASASATDVGRVVSAGVVAVGLWLTFVTGSTTGLKADAARAAAVGWVFLPELVMVLHHIAVIGMLSLPGISSDLLGFSLGAGWTLGLPPGLGGAGKALHEAILPEGAAPSPKNVGTQAFAYFVQFFGGADPASACFLAGVVGACIIVAVLLVIELGCRGLLWLHTSSGGGWFPNSAVALHRAPLHARGLLVRYLCVVYFALVLLATSDAILLGRRAPPTFPPGPVLVCLLVVGGCIGFVMWSLVRVQTHISRHGGGRLLSVPLNPLKRSETRWHDDGDDDDPEAGMLADSAARGHGGKGHGRKGKGKGHRHAKRGVRKEPGVRPQSDEYFVRYPVSSPVSNRRGQLRYLKDNAYTPEGADGLVFRALMGHFRGRRQLFYAWMFAFQFAEAVAVAALFFSGAAQIGVLVVINALWALATHRQRPFDVSQRNRAFFWLCMYKVATLLVCVVFVFDPQAPGSPAPSKSARNAVGVVVLVLHVGVVSVMALAMGARAVKATAVVCNARNASSSAAKSTVAGKAASRGSLTGGTKAGKKPKKSKKKGKGKKKRKGKKAHRSKSRRDSRRRAHSSSSGTGSDSGSTSSGSSSGGYSSDGGVHGAYEAKHDGVYGPARSASSGGGSSYAPPVIGPALPPGRGFGGPDARALST